MTLDEILIQERERYLTFFRLAVKDEKVKYDSCVSEILLKPNKESQNDQPEVFQLFRYDLLYKKPNGQTGISEINLDSLLAYNPEKFSVGEMKVTINPFVWNGCEFFISKQTYDWDVFFEWANKWIDIDGKMEPNENGEDGVIHNVTFPVEENEKYVISVDFGTSPLSAFKELLTIFARQGIQEIIIDSTFMRTNN